MRRNAGSAGGRSFVRGIFESPRSTGLSRRIGILLILIVLAMSRGWSEAKQTGCEQARRTNHWCRAGNVGYVAGLEIRSRFLYEVLDAHGHTIVPQAVQCDVCREALKSHGYCPAHRMGYVGGRAYMTPLTYYLARGRRVDPASITCPICRKNLQGIGWCERDHVGIVGTTALDDRQEFEELTKAYQILVAAIQMSSTCERCSGAMVADGYCAIHRIKFKDGVPVPGFAGVSP